jgi:hypothetical protein
MSTNEPIQMQTVGASKPGEAWSPKSTGSSALMSGVPHTSTPVAVVSSSDANAPKKGSGAWWEEDDNEPMPIDPKTDTAFRIFGKIVELHYAIGAAVMIAGIVVRVLATSRPLTGVPIFTGFLTIMLGLLAHSNRSR